MLKGIIVEKILFITALMVVRYCVLCDRIDNEDDWFHDLMAVRHLVEH